MFGVVGEASTGKTSLLLHMHWRFNCRQRRLMKELRSYDTTWAYFQVPDSEAEISAPPAMSIHSPSPSNPSNNTASDINDSDSLSNQQFTSNIVGVGNNNIPSPASHQILSSLGLAPYTIVSPDAPKLPSRFVAIYTFGSELVRRDVGPHGGFEIPTLLDAAYSTYLLRLPYGQVPVEKDTFISAYTTLIAEQHDVVDSHHAHPHDSQTQTSTSGASSASSHHHDGHHGHHGASHHHNGTGIVLLVDGFDFVEQSKRAALISSLAITLNPASSPSLPAQAASAASIGGLISPIFRIFFGSRPNGLFKIEEIPDSVIFLCLDRLFSVDWKEKLLARIAPDIAGEFARLGRESVETRIHRRLIRSCHSPLLVFLLAQLRKHLPPSPLPSSIAQQTASAGHASSSPSHLQSFTAYSKSAATLPSEITACLYDMFDNFFTLIVRQSKLVRKEPIDVPKVFKIVGHGVPFEVEEGEFFQLVDLVSFFYHCWTPETWRRDWSTRERFEHLMFYLFKHQSALLHNTILGRLREHFLVQRARSAASAASSNTSSSLSSNASSSQTNTSTTLSASSVGDEQQAGQNEQQQISSSSSGPSSNANASGQGSSSSTSSSSNDTAYVECAGALWMAVAEWLVSVGLAHRLASTVRTRNRMNSMVAANQANIVAILQNGSAGIASGNTSSQNSDASPVAATNQGDQMSNQSSNLSPQTSSDANPSHFSKSVPMSASASGVSTPAAGNTSSGTVSASSSLGYGQSFEILLKDEQQVQFQIARFLMNVELSGPILDAIASARSSMRGFDVQYPCIFSWQDSYFLTNKHWNYIFDMMASKRGAVWLSKTLLPPTVSISDWLAQMRLHKGVDKDDLGQIRFYRLLRGFALQQEDRDLSMIRQRVQREQFLSSQNSQQSSSDSRAQQHYDTGVSSSGYLSTSTARSSLDSIGSSHDQASQHADKNENLARASAPPAIASGASASVIDASDSIRLSLASSSKSLGRSTPKTAEEVEIADLKEAFGMTFVSILEDNPSAIVHIEKAPVSSLTCFSQNAISIILDKMVFLLKQGNIFVVADLLINLDRHGLIGNDIVNRIVEIVTSSKDHKPIRPALRFLSSRTPSHLHLGAIISCLAAKDQDAQSEAMDAITTVAKTAVKLSKESFEKNVHWFTSSSPSSSAPNSPQQPRHTKQYDKPSSSSQTAQTGNQTNSSSGVASIPSSTAFGPFDAEHIRTEAKLPDDMVITGPSQTQAGQVVEELYLMEAAHDSESLAVSPPANEEIPVLLSPMREPPSHASAGTSHQSQNQLQSSTPVTFGPGSASIPQVSDSHQPSSSNNAHYNKVKFLFEDREWSLLVRSAVSLLVDFVGLDLHKASKNASYYSSVHEPRVRMIQCKHLASLIEMMESDEPGTRLLPFILLGTTIRSNDYEREKEKQQLEAQICILEAIGRVYNSRLRSGSSSASSSHHHDLVEEMARDSPINRGIGYVFHDLLGQQAAKYAVMSEELIKCKPDLLEALNSWAFARLSSDNRRSIFMTLSMHQNLLVQQSILDLVSNNRALIETMDPTDLTVVIASNFPADKSIGSASSGGARHSLSANSSPAGSSSHAHHGHHMLHHSYDVPIPLKRAALRFLELSALTTHSQDYRLHAIDKIVYLLARFGFNDPVVTEPLLRILDTIMSTPTVDGTNGNGNGQQENQIPSQSQSNRHGCHQKCGNSIPHEFVSTFATKCPFPEDIPRPYLTKQERLELYKLLQRNNMRQKLIQAFEAQSPKHFWTGKVLTCSLLRHFVSPDSEDALEYVQFLKSTVPEIRAIALSELHRIDSSLVPALLQRLKELISYEEPLVRTTYALVVGSLGMRPEQQAMAIDVACYHMTKDDSPDIQQHGVSILSILGESVAESVLVAERFENILHQKYESLLRGGRLSVEENGLLMAMVECITNIKLTTTTVLTTLLGLLKESGDPALRSAICLAFKRLSFNDLTSEQKQACQEHVLVLLQNREGYVREIGIKLIRFFGREMIKTNASKLIKMISDQELYVRKQAIKAVTCLLQKGDEQTKKEALLLLPAVSSALEDKSPLVIVQALKFLVLLKARSRSVAVTIARLAARSSIASSSSVSGSAGPSGNSGGASGLAIDPEDEAQISIDAEGVPVISSMPSSSSSHHQASRSGNFSSLDRARDRDLEGMNSSQNSGSSGASSSTSGNPSSLSSGGNGPSSSSSGNQQGSSLTDTEDDPWYVRKVILPNQDRILSLLYRRRYRFNLAIKVGVLNCLGTTRLLGQHLGSFSEMLNSESVPTLVEFSDAMRRLGPGMLQYIPAIVNAIKPGSPLVRNMVRLLARYEKQMDAKTCSRLFSLQTILSMMKNKDANVRKVAVSLMGKKVLEKSKHIWVIIQMWGDKNNKVRKEVMEVLGDIGKTNPQYISHIMNLIDTDSVSSVLVWRFLSKSWGVLIGNVSSASPDDI